jgi:uncharacterized protein (TIGR02300 family)
MLKVLEYAPSYHAAEHAVIRCGLERRDLPVIPAIDRCAATSQVKHRIFQTGFKEPPDVAKPDLGTKRLCSGCGAKFYDLNKTPIVCPKCETVFVPVVATTRARPEAVKAAAPVPAAETVVPETAEAEFVSLDDAEAEQQGKKPAAKGEEAEGGEDAIEDAAFIEEQEEGADVTDIIGEAPIEKEEEQYMPGNSNQIFL